ncbi:AsmA-like C-terminal region-containing protein [Chitinimonas sp. BJB300]|uniref:AsmA-like C-terminal region-containing protein n=1 Tax=Chitinimonas sp. BJB300 TaxID=1559339 RepID=UPI000C108DB8|nr:AsmA-like C-terminal region-containing protein [Chitinimonas sp. BJB300]PHV10918.1 hypothetical protein CSQ89_13625 [Chitinimonas sp. BJB300]TSJ89950.1 hypothetical protein FG002_007095 [Chitinimonas sp. BJB300]
MSALKKLLIIVLVLAAIVAAVPMLIPYDSYKSDVEQSLSGRLGTKVQIGAIAFSYSPKPEVQLRSVELGQPGENSIAKIAIPITMRNVLKFGQSLADVTMESASIKYDFALLIPERLKAPLSDDSLRISSLKITDLKIQLPKNAVGPLSGTFAFKPDGALNNITLNSADEHVKVDIKPAEGQLALSLEARNWDLPGKYPAHFDQLVLRGLADKNGLLIDEISGMLFGSVATGQAQLDWVDGWKLHGTLQTRGMQVEPLIALGSPISRATGRMTAAATFDFASDDYSTLLDQPSVEVKFSLTDGRLHNFDLITPLKSSNPSVLQRGGQTSFDTLIGTYTLDKHVVSLSGLALNSGKFTASGKMTIDDKSNLSGSLATRLASGVIVINAPLRIDGTLSAPELRSSGAAKSGSGDSTTRIF